MEVWVIGTHPGLSAIVQWWVLPERRRNMTLSLLVCAWNATATSRSNCDDAFRGGLVWCPTHLLATM